MSKEDREKQRERVEDINKCSTPASIAEYLEDNPFINENLDSHKIQLILENALLKPTNLNFTQYQLKLQSLGSPGSAILGVTSKITPPRAYAVLLRIMEVRFSLDRLDL